MTFIPKPEPPAGRRIEQLRADDRAVLRELFMPVIEIGRRILARCEGTPRDCLILRSDPWGKGNGVTGIERYQGQTIAFDDEEPDVDLFSKSAAAAFSHANLRETAFLSVQEHAACVGDNLTVFVFWSERGRERDSVLGDVRRDLQALAAALLDPNSRPGRLGLTFKDGESHVLAVSEHLEGTLTAHERLLMEAILAGAGEVTRKAMKAHCFFHKTIMTRVGEAIVYERSIMFSLGGPRTFNDLYVVPLAP